jgi:hypothetical protein
MLKVLRLKGTGFGPYIDTTKTLSAFGESADFGETFLRG